ncbi:hypothetical protein M3O96_19735 [Aquiflexum sp. TKW24L]|uniref:hypothetical protein n=1 Tax=Aquiflexum sp. TKW24L TaxID=2942212 RepID=UPI0020BDA3FE|nr:hypothetical protein [Aquiflexum sp. TKW24L]MCL6261341.1 hypothetical protein [Aquiflexum sp. TKW24L]
MKQLIILSILILGISSFCSAQKIKDYDLEREVKINFVPGDKVTVPKRIKTGDFYRVVVDSINLNNYRVEINVKDTVYYSKALDFPVFGSIDLTGLSDILGKFNAAELAKALEASPDSIAIDNKKFKVDPKKKNPLTEKILSRLKDEEEYLKKFGIILKAENEKIDSLSYELMTIRITSKINPIPRDFNSIDIKGKLQGFTRIKIILSKLEADLKANEDKLKEYFSNPDVILLMNTPGIDSILINTEKTKVDKAISELKTNTAKAKSQVSSENAEKALVSIVHLYNQTTYTSLPIQFTGEEAEIKMSFIPKDSASNLQTYHLSPIKFGRSPWYWAVGPGLYYSNLQSERVGFETVQVNDSTQNFKVLKESPLEGEIGVSALFHAGYKLPILHEFFGVHGSIGTGISLGEEIRARLLYGFGVSIGKKNHLTANIGWATGYVDNVSASFNEEDYGTKLFVEKPSVLIKNLDTGIFYNVGYVFTF